MNERSLPHPPNRPTRFVPSPNHSERTRPVSLLVLHYTETATLEQAVRILTDPDAPKPVSSHYVVGLDGEVVQLVAEDRRARHAGVSFWRGETDVNSASVGIEIVNAGPGPDGAQPAFPEAQIAAVVDLCHGIMARHAIADVVAHSDVAPQRKRDPGAAFPWCRLAAEGIGLWTDRFDPGDASDATLLASIGYDVSDLAAALRAFQLHFYPEAILSGGTRTHERLVAVERLFRERRAAAHPGVDGIPLFSFRPIGFFRGAAARKYDAPRQGAFAARGEGAVELLPGRNFETALRDLDGFERVWIVFVFDRNGGAWRPTTRPPVPAPGRDRVGLFATRAPYRPNPIGLTCARLVGVHGLHVEVAEADLLDGTPVLDLKPYVPAADAFPEARAGWVDAQAPDRREVAESPLFREQAAAILALGGPDLAATARLQLSLDPFDATRKRVTRRDGPGEGTLALRMFRVDFRADPASPALLLERIRSAYAAADLADPADPHGDKDLHRLFVRGSVERMP